MTRVVTILVAASLMLLSGCYNASVVTDAQPSAQTIENNWAHGFLYGLVPPSTVETAEQCPNGVARVETQLSFPNMLANFLTGGLYSPMSIEVRCAQGGTASLMEAPDVASIQLSATDSEEEVRAAFDLAAVQSAESGEAVNVHFDK